MHVHAAHVPDVRWRKQAFHDILLQLEERTLITSSTRFS